MIMLTFFCLLTFYHHYIFIVIILAYLMIIFIILTALQIWDLIFIQSSYFDIDYNGYLLF